MSVAKNWRVASRRKGSMNTQGVRVPGKGLFKWDIGASPMTASDARKAAKELNTTYPDYEHVAIKVDRKGNPL